MMLRRLADFTVNVTTKHHGATPEVAVSPKARMATDSGNHEGGWSGRAGNLAPTELIGAASSGEAETPSHGRRDKGCFWTLQQEFGIAKLHRSSCRWHVVLLPEPVMLLSKFAPLALRFNIPKAWWDIVSAFCISNLGLGSVLKTYTWGSMIYIKAGKQRRWLWIQPRIVSLRPQ